MKASKLQKNTHYTQEDKIDLRELFSILKKRKKLIWSVTTLLALLALVYIFITKPVYEIKTMIEVGQIDAQPIDNINDIKQKLTYEYQVNVRGKEVALPRVKAISIPKKSKSILSLTVHANNNEEGINYIQTVISKIETQYQEKTNAYTKSQNESIQITQQDIVENRIAFVNMKKELDTYSQKIISLKSEDAALAGIYALQIGQKQSQLIELKKYISTLKNKRQELELSISPFMIKATYIVGEIETLDKPIKPQKALIIIVAFITGFMLSVFLAFFLEFIGGIKNEEEAA